MVEKRYVHIAIALFFIFSSLILVYAYSQTLNPGHGADSIYVSINGTSIRLQNAIDQDKLKASLIGGIPVINGPLGHSGSEILINLNGIEQSLQQAINNGSLCCSSCSSVTSYSNNLKLGHYATNIIVINKSGNEESLQQAISKGEFCVPHGSQSFTSVGAYTFTVPQGVNSLNVSLYGAGGGGATYYFTGDGFCGSGGGGGAYLVNQPLSVSSGEILSLTVGGGGGANSGGSSSSIYRSGNALIIAGGGAGATPGVCIPGGAGGTVYSIVPISYTNGGQGAYSYGGSPGCFYSVYGGAGGAGGNGYGNGGQGYGIYNGGPGAGGNGAAFLSW